ncbi:1,2-dihydroxy-3-keto-5-methylthiopentene dioxygenase [Pendulispora albinea]|uniref:Acireductone dioxygenase n=1 Tax=Pendulispora albinea TaxID=2741071 RepID=A0ABZ2LUJ5_9BACT
MSHLRIYRDDTRPDVFEDHTTFETIRDAAAEANIRFERWDASQPLAEAATQADILTAYAEAITRLERDCGFATADVVSVSASTPNHPELRKKFLNEHTHSEDEARFFVEGSGLFCIHHGGAIYALECTKGDLINVPAGTRHWFDMGPSPRFVAIRLFTDPKGWIADFTGSDVAARFPRFEKAA